MRSVLLLSLLLLVSTGISACNKEEEKTYPLIQEHVKYIESLGWTIEKARGDATPFDETRFNFPEFLQVYKNAGLDLLPYKGQNLKTKSYDLKDKLYDNGKNLELIVEIFFTDKQIVGGVISIEDYIPGIVKLEEKEQFYSHFYSRQGNK